MESTYPKRQDRIGPYLFEVGKGVRLHVYIGFQANGSVMLTTYDRGLNVDATDGVQLNGTTYHGSLIVSRDGDVQYRSLHRSRFGTDDMTDAAARKLCAAGAELAGEIYSRPLIGRALQEQELYYAQMHVENLATDIRDAREKLAALCERHDQESAEVGRMLEAWRMGGQES